ncbi:MAG TPA: flavodoxin domain-containing protein, partial [Stellaceae bacterium]|nr:flavodoxin domain-containing protein [Stellaceae bacterium]
MDQPLTILVGTMTGTAQLVAEEVADALKARGVAAEVLPMDRLDAGVFARSPAFLICSSTYGQGDVPDNAQALFADLERAKPD